MEPKKKIFVVMMSLELHNDTLVGMSLDLGIARNLRDDRGGDSRIYSVNMDEPLPVILDEEQEVK